MRGRVLAAILGAAAVASPPSHAAGPSWAGWASSPRPVDAASLEPMERAALEACGQGDEGLRDTARAVLRQKLHGLPIPELDAIEAAQRAAGEPHPWPRVWAASARGLNRDAVLPRLQAWLGAASRTRRCGVAEGNSPDGRRTVVVVTVDALADLAPLPIRARTGQWLTVEARMRAPATGGRVVVMHGDEAPRTVPSWFDGTTLRARFTADRPGEMAVQV
ncbi:MAG TPA: CAP domain-containing protein, partial [Polyangiaceae bacterium]|nr:CAP domain-containing protein [Polyangiaceae bacterium]